MSQWWECKVSCIETGLELSQCLVHGRFSRTDAASRGAWTSHWLHCPAANAERAHNHNKTHKKKPVGDSESKRSTQDKIKHEPLPGSQTHSTWCHAGQHFSGGKSATGYSWGLLSWFWWKSVIWGSFIVTEVRDLRNRFNLLTTSPFKTLREGVKWKLGIRKVFKCFRVLQLES